jgi:hypothetical protein
MKKGSAYLSKVEDEFKIKYVLKKIMELLPRRDEAYLPPHKASSLPRQKSL